MKLIVGLGNPGKEYRKHRHNIGFRIMEAFAEKHGGIWNTSKFDAEICEFSPSNVKGHMSMVLVKPTTFMNLSGKSIAKLAKFYKLDATKDLLIVYDDKDMIFGKLRERNEGSAGGLNGIKSIIAELGTENFHRLKFGVGHEHQKIPTDAFVLQNFSKDEEEQLSELIDEAVEKIEAWIASTEVN